MFHSLIIDYFYLTIWLGAVHCDGESVSITFTLIKFFSRIGCLKNVVICGGSDAGADSLTRLDEPPTRGLNKFIYLLNI